MTSPDGKTTWKLPVNITQDKAKKKGCETPNQILGKKPPKAASEEQKAKLKKYNENLHEPQSLQYKSRTKTYLPPIPG